MIQPPEAQRFDPVEALNTLGIAWGVYELYPNPTEQAAFASAMERLEPLGGETITFEIGAGMITCAGEEIPLSRGGTERLSLRLFVHEVEWLQLNGKPDPRELNDFFDLLAGEEEAVRERGGIEAAVSSRQIRSIAVTPRGLLTGALEDPWEEVEVGSEGGGDAEGSAIRLARMVSKGASAEAVAESLMDATDGDPEEIAEAFCDAYRTIYGEIEEATEVVVEAQSQLLAAYRQAPRRRPPVDTFAEAFFLIPEEARARILGEFLIHRMEGLHSLFLDQFAGLELAELAALLDDNSFAELEAYVRDVVDTDSGSAEELLPLVSSARDVNAARQSAADRVRAMIEGIGGLGGSKGGLAGQLRRELMQTPVLGVRALQSLLVVEERADRFSRLLDTWCERIGTLVRAGDMASALEYLEAGTSLDALAPHKAEALAAALGSLISNDYAIFIDAYQDQDRRDDVVALVANFGVAATQELMERLAVEESATARRALIGLLVDAGASQPEALVRYLSDERWYVVRNAITIFARGASELWLPRLVGLAQHEDHRVVVETLRALAPIEPDAATPVLVRSLVHSHERVRETAVVLLHGSEASNVEVELVAAMTDRHLAGGRDAMAEILFALGSPSALEALERIAKRPFLLRSHMRDARKAARSALGSAA